MHRKLKIPVSFQTMQNSAHTNIQEIICTSSQKNWLYTLINYFHHILCLQNLLFVLSLSSIYQNISWQNGYPSPQLWNSLPPESDTRNS